MSVLYGRSQGDLFSDLAIIEEANVVRILNLFIQLLNMAWEVLMASHNPRADRATEIDEVPSLVSLSSSERRPLAPSGELAFGQREDRASACGTGCVQQLQRVRAALQMGLWGLCWLLPGALGIDLCHLVHYCCSRREPAPRTGRTSRRTAAWRPCLCRKWWRWQTRTHGNWSRSWR